MRYRILTVTAIALAMLTFHGCGDDAKPAPATTTEAKPTEPAKPAEAAKPADAKPAAAPAAPATK